MILLPDCLRSNVELAVRRWRYPMTCKGRPEYLTEMAPALDVPLGTHASFLPDIADRPVDIAFSGCALAHCACLPKRRYPPSPRVDYLRCVIPRCERFSMQQFCLQMGPLKLCDVRNRPAELEIMQFSVQETTALATPPLQAGVIQHWTAAWIE